MEEEHALLIYFRYESDDLDSLFCLQAQLESAITSANAGIFDGNDISLETKEVILFMYGPDCSVLLQAVSPILLSSSITSRAKIKLRYGLPGANTKEDIIVVGIWPDAVG